VKPTVVGQIVVPPDYEMVALGQLKTVDGAAVVVRCDRLDELVVSELTNAFPGAAQPEVQRDVEQETKNMLEVAPKLIEAGTSLIDEDGNEVRPAFYFGVTPVVPHPKSVPGSALRIPDRLLLCNAIMRLCGFGGDAEGSFHGDNGSGDVVRVDIVADGASQRPDPVGSSA
jgi:hypothetical protein